MRSRMNSAIRGGMIMHHTVTSKRHRSVTRCAPRIPTAAAAARGLLAFRGARRLSRLAWLCVHIKEIERAARIVAEGLELEPNNEYLLRLATRLKSETPAGGAIRRW